MNVPQTVLLIANPTSGRGRGRTTADGVSDGLRARGFEVAVRFTEGRGDAERITAASLGDGDRRPGIIVACGGDGTIQEIAHALAVGTASATTVGRVGSADNEPSLALAPSGRCNDFARALGIATDVKSIVAAIADGKRRPIDLGSVNGRHFCTVVTAGIDAEVTDFVDRMKMPLAGTPAYVYGALRVLLRYRPYHVRLEGDFGRIDRPIFIASSANTSSYGGAIPIAPDASPTDGLLDVCVITYMSKLRALAMIPRVMRGRHPGHPQVQFVKTKRYSITSDEPLELWADGERIGRTPATIEVVPGAISVCVPPPLPRGD